MSKLGVFSGPYFSAFSPNTGKYGPEITPCLNTFNPVLVSKNNTELLLSACEENTSSTRRRGTRRREQHPAIQKAEVIHDYEAGVKQDIIAAKYRINRSLVSNMNFKSITWIFSISIYECSRRF